MNRNPAVSPQLDRVPVVEVIDVVRTYAGSGGLVRAVDGVSAGFAPGTFTVVAGPSGSGKSTLLRVLALIDRPDSGRVNFAASDVTRVSDRERRLLRRRHIGYLFQQPVDNLLDYLDAAQHVRLGSRLRADADLAASQHLLDVLGLGDRRSHRPAHLSGGEQQRLAFAFAVAGAPSLVVADEPTAALDHMAAGRLLEALVALAQRGITVIASSHDPAVIEAADAVVRIMHGRREA